MYKLLKDTIKSFLYCTPLGPVILYFWGLIEFLINILLKIFIVFPLYLFRLLLNFIKLQLTKLFSNTKNQNESIKKFKFILAILFIGYSIFWFYCAYAFANKLPFLNSEFMQSIQIINNFPSSILVFLLIPLGYMIFTIISLTEELGFLGTILTVFNIIAFMDTNVVKIFTNTTAFLFIFCILYYISKIHPLEFHSEIMKDLSADETLDRIERLSYYRKKKW